MQSSTQILYCEEHDISVSIDTANRTIRYQASPLGVGGRPLPGCEALRLAAQAMDYPDRVTGAKGPILPRTGRHLCRLSLLSPGEDRPALKPIHGSPEAGIGLPGDGTKSAPPWRPQGPERLLPGGARK